MKLKTPISIFLITKVFTLGMFAFLIYMYYDTYYSGTGRFYSAFIETMISWDSGHYTHIGLKGYDDIFRSVFFPLYPVVIGFAAKLFNIDISLAGIIISNICLLIAVIFMYNLVMLNYNERAAFYSVLFFMLAPTSLFYITVYTESLFLMLTVISFYYIYRKKWLAAAVFAGFSTATRNSGVFILIPFVYMLYTTYKKDLLKYNFGVWMKCVAYLFISALGMIAYMAFLYIKTGNPVMFITAQKGFGVKPNFPFWQLLMHLKNFTVQFQPKLTMDRNNLSFVYMVSVVLLFIAGYRKLKKPDLLYLVFVVVYINVISAYNSTARYISAIYPVWVLLALWAGSVKRSKLVPLSLIAVLMLWQVYMNARWAFGLWVQ